MSDYIDKVFKSVDSSQLDLDVSRDELLGGLQDQPQQPQTNQQQVAQAPRRNQVRRDGGQQYGPARNNPLQGVGKWIEENISIPAVDAIDNTFQGNQKTPDQIARERANQRTTFQESIQRTRDVSRNDPAAEAVRSVGGGIRGAAASVLNAGELIGDTVRFGASLGNVKDTENPFHNKYEWALWDLGRDELGAQTGAGKVAQGFLEFGVLMLGTGGFGGLPAAGAKFAAAGSTAAKLGVLARAGARGAASGLPADLISATTRGEGNLSTLIKENAPDWYPSWLNALAVDQDDSPWEAVLKTGLEGMGLGFAADAAGAYIGGVRALRRATKAGVPEEQAAQQAVKEVQDILNNSQRASSATITSTRPTQQLTAEQYVEALTSTKAAKPTDYWSVDAVDLETASSGKIVTVDGGAGIISPDGDIKGVFKFADTQRRGVANDILQEAVRQGGIKLDNFNNYLTSIYEDNGFRTVGRVPFNREYAPPGWDEALHGTPDVVAMIHDPKGLLDLVPDGRKFDDYDDLIAYRDQFITAHPELKPIKSQLAQNNTAFAVTPLPNGNRIRWRLQADPDINLSYGLTNEVKALEITWSMEDPESLIQNYGRYGFTDFQRIAREELNPGTIVFNSPANDTYGRGPSRAQLRRQNVDIADIRRRYLAGFNEEGRARRAEYFDTRNEFELARIIEPYLDSNPGIRQRLYSRAGFGPVNSEGIQAAIVRSSPDGRGRWLKPINDFGNPESLLAAINSERPYLQRADELLRSVRNTEAEAAYAQQYNQETYNNYARQFNITPEEAVEQFRREDAYGRDPWMSIHNTTFRARLEDEIRTNAYNASPRAQRLQSVISQSERGIPVTWDDVAEVVPEYFAAGSREITELHPNVFQEVRFAQPDRPSFIDPATGNTPAWGYGVNVDYRSLEDFSEEGVADFIARNQDILSREDAFLKASVGENGPVVEIVRVLEDQDEARFLGSLFDQPAIDDINLVNQIPMGGGDSLRYTQGDHLRTQTGRPFEQRTIDSTTAIGQQLEARQGFEMGVRGGSQPTVTQAQLSRIARSIGDEPAQILRQMVRENPVDLQELSSISRMPVEQIVEDAARGIQDALGTTGEVDFNKLLTMNVGEDSLLTQAGIVQVRGLMQEITSRLYESSYNIMKLGEADMDSFPQVEIMVDNLKALLRVHKESANAYSRMLSAYKIKVPGLGIEISNPFSPPPLEKVTAELKAADKVLDDLVSKLASGEPSAQREAWRIANALLLADGDATKTIHLSKYLKEISMGQALKIMYNSMLSSPKTQIVNLMSNAMNTMYRPVAGFVGGDAKVKQAAIASLYNFHDTLNAAFTMAKKAWADGPITEGSKMMIRQGEEEARLQLLQRAVEVSGDQALARGVNFVTMLKAMADFPLFSWPSKLLTTSDELFKTMIGRMEYNTRTMLKAIEESTGSGQTVTETFERLLQEGTDKAFDAKTGALKDEDLIAAAKDSTFQTDLEGAARSFADLINEFPPLRPFFPFVKTGHNIMVFAASHVPYLHKALGEYKAVMEGEDEYAKAIWKGREAVGRFIVISGAAAAFADHITGNGPPDPAERKVWLQTNAPRSIRVGEYTDKDGNKKTKWFDYSRIEPFGQILSAVADLVQMSKYGWRNGLGEDQREYLAGYLTYAIAMNLTNKSYMQGVVPLGQMLTPGWQGLSTLSKLPAEVANNFIPLSGARRSLANGLNPYMQEYDGALQRLMSTASAGLYKLPIKYDYLDGKPMFSPSGGVNALLPFAVQDKNADPVRLALTNIEFESSDVMKSESGVKLKPEHISRVQQLMGQSGLYQELKKLVTHENFPKVVEQYRSDLRAGIAGDKRNQFFYREILRIHERYRDAALDRVKQEFPELVIDINKNRNQITSARRGSMEANQPQQSFENLVNLPIK
jgi:hypothetical protein